MERTVDPGSGLTFSATYFSPQSLETKTRKSQSVAPLSGENACVPQNAADRGRPPSSHSSREVTASRASPGCQWAAHLLLSCIRASLRAGTLSSFILSPGIHRRSASRLRELKEFVHTQAPAKHARHHNSFLSEVTRGRPRPARPRGGSGPGVKAHGAPSTKQLHAWQ